MDGNYIKLCRSILDWEWYGDQNTRDVFIHCLLKANWKDGRFEGHEIPRGSFVTSIAKLSDELRLTSQQIRTALNHLKSTNEITITSTPKFSVITINNYGQYQGGNKQSNKQLTNKQQTTNKQLTNKQQTTNNNRRKEEEKEEQERKESKKGKNKTYYPNDSKLDEAFRDYVDMRKSIKAPMTDRAITLAINKLENLSTVNGKMDNDLAIAILEQSTMNSWKGLFELKGGKKSTGDVFDEWRNA